MIFRVFKYFINSRYQRVLARTNPQSFKSEGGQFLKKKQVPNRYSLINLVQLLMKCYCQQDSAIHSFFFIRTRGSFLLKI